MLQLLLIIITATILLYILNYKSVLFHSQTHKPGTYTTNCHKHSSCSSYYITLKEYSISAVCVRMNNYYNLHNRLTP